MRKGLIADVQRASLHDGDGIRTTVFFKGCPLKCEWCHNPECIEFEKQIMYYPEKCIACNKCDEGCFSGARVLCGKDYTSDELLEEILLDKPYYAQNGGVTFSGGEPLAQKDFLDEILDKCIKEKINCAIETSLVYYDEILKKFDFIMADFKIWNSEIHKKCTGISNDAIKENFIKVNKLNVPIIARTPVILEIEQGIDKISEFLKNLENVRQYELLPYHPLGTAKEKALGIKAKKFKIPTEQYMKEVRKYAFIR